MVPASFDSCIAIPNEFICPITLNIMEFPMATRLGGNFERAAIAAWLHQGHNQCPLTRMPLRLSDLIHNRFLAVKIAHWRATNGTSLLTESTVTDDGESKDLKDDNDTDKEEERLWARMFGTATETELVVAVQVFW